MAKENFHAVPPDTDEGEFKAVEQVEEERGTTCYHCEKIRRDRGVAASGARLYPLRGMRTLNLRVQRELEKEPGVPDQILDLIGEYRDRPLCGAHARFLCGLIGREKDGTVPLLVARAAQERNGAVREALRRAEDTWVIRAFRVKALTDLEAFASGLERPNPWVDRLIEKFQAELEAEERAAEEKARRIKAPAGPKQPWEKKGWENCHQGRGGGR